MGYSCTSGASGTGVADFSYYLTFLDGKRNDGCHWGPGQLCVGVLSAVERVKFVSESLSLCIILGGCWCGIIILNVHAQTEDTNGNT